MNEMVHLAGHVQVGENDVKGIGSPSALKFVHGQLAIHDRCHLTVPCPLQYAQCHLKRTVEIEFIEFASAT